MVHGIFQATGFAMTGDTGVAVFRNTTTNCPLCGTMSEILPGRYELVGDRMNVLLDGDISQAALGALRNIVERLQRNEITPAQARTEAESITPKAGRLFDIADWSDGAKATLYASIIGGIALIAAAKMSSGGSPQPPQIVIENVIERQKDALRDSTSLPYIPVPTPRPK
ncbi:hypothetical protein CK219_05295 [Mesorhizobium sp. WSM4313]|nr:hypothetical protein CK219_05295 [Mesorhizobium sp. WSM4313]